MSRLAVTLRLLLFLALVAGFGLGAPAHGRQPSPVPSAQALASVALAELPPEARQTLNLIQRGGPFPYPNKDGSIFGNFEKRLPQQPRGYYREYTVPTPGSGDRGARRIVAGRGSPENDAANSGEYYYSGDHYRSFRKIRQP